MPVMPRRRYDGIRRARADAANLYAPKPLRGQLFEGDAAWACGWRAVSITIPAGRIGALARAFEVLRSEVADVASSTIRYLPSDNFTTSRARLAGGSAVEARYGYLNWRSVQPSEATQTGHHAVCVAVGEGREQPGWTSTLRLLANTVAAGGIGTKMTKLEMA